MEAPTGQGVYLIHLDAPIGTAKQQARHYIGFSVNIAMRLDTHGTAKGARMLYAARKQYAVKFRLARVWLGGDRALERHLKNYKRAARFCPICSERAAKEVEEEEAQAIQHVERVEPSEWEYLEDSESNDDCVPF